MNDIYLNAPPMTPATFIKVDEGYVLLWFRVGEGILEADVPEEYSEILENDSLEGALKLAEFVESWTRGLFEVEIMTNKLFWSAVKWHMEVINFLTDFDGTVQ